MKNSDEIRRAQILKPWLAIRVVALMANGVPVKRIANMTDRGLVDHCITSTGKNSPRLYSFASAIQIHAAHTVATQLKLSFSASAEVGKVCIKRFLDRFDEGDRDFDDSECAWHSLLFWYDPKGELKHVSVSSDYLSEQLRNEGTVFSQAFQKNFGKSVGISPLSYGQLDVDRMLFALWTNYLEIDHDFNNKALEGKLKPFPKHLS